MIKSFLRPIPIACVVMACSAAFSSVFAKSDLDDLSGSVVATVDGKEMHLPLLKADYRLKIDGDAAHVELTQTFVNPTRKPLHATYLFPLNQRAAIHAMRMSLDNETIVARIKKKEDAQQIFDEAKASGKAATLLTQHRPNMFTQDIANLMPGKTVQVTLEYVQNVPKIDGAYELIVPMVVGPRYENVSPKPTALTSSALDDDFALKRDDRLLPASQVETVSGWHIDKLPAYPNVIGQDAPEEIDPKRVSLDLNITAPMPITSLQSDTHALDVVDAGETKSIRFADGLAIDNRDFVLRYELAAQSDVTAGVSSTFQEDKGGYFSLLIEPPQLPAEDTIGKRELVFVLDTSGSMSGAPMAASKTFMREAISGLRPDDHFRILRFSNTTSEFAKQAVRASEANKKSALRFVEGLSANGGTELNKAMNDAFDRPQLKGASKLVVFLTDGYIGADREVISTIARRIGNARIYSFGVGDAVNRFLLDAMAKEGRGYARYVGLGESAQAAAKKFAAKLKTPLLTDITIDWNGLQVQSQTPAKLPDLFEGGSLRVMGRYQTGGQHTIFVDGLVNGRAARLPVKLDLATSSNPKGNIAKALPLLWAREQIFDKNRAYTIGGSSNEVLKKEITDLALRYSLQSRFTSFVAVSEKVVNSAPTSASQTNVPLPQVSGVSKSAYPSLNLSGSSTPEPEGILGLMVILLAFAVRFRKKLRSFLSACTNRVRKRFTYEPSPDSSLPRALRRDAWWLESK